MKIIDNKTIEKPAIYLKNNSLYAANDAFINLTGYTDNDVEGKSLQQLSEILRSSSDFCCKDNKVVYKGFIFTNHNEPKEIEMIYEDLDGENEKVCFIKEISTEFLKGVLATCVDNSKDNKSSEAIYSYPELVYLKTNSNFIDKLKFFAPKNFDLIGNIFSPSNYILNYIKECGYYYKEKEEIIDYNGNIGYWTIKANLIYQNGEAKYLKATFVDETEKVVARKDIEKQKKEMEIILANIPDSIVTLNNKGEYTYTNKMNLDKFSLYVTDDEPLTNRKVFKYFKYNDVNGRELLFEETPDVRVLNGEKLNNYTVIGTSNLSTTYHECNGTPIYNNEGNIEGAVLIYRNIENTFKVDEYNALAENIKTLDINYATMSAENFKIKYINNNAFESIKRSHPYVDSVIEVIGCDFFSLYTDDINEKEEIINKIKSCIEEKTNKYVHTQKFVENEKANYVKTIFQPIFDENNQIKKISSIGMYITDEELANQQMANSLKAQEEIFVNTSHELKTPINLIFSASQLANVYLKGEATENKMHKIKGNNQIIMQNCYRTIKLINNILDVSKMEQGFYELNLENRNIVNVVEDIVYSVSNYIKDNKLKIIFDPQIEEKIIAIDLYKFERIMLNLISNAIKFSKIEDIIFIGLVDRGNTIEVSVKDEGIGIDEKNMDCIFNKFKQENKSLNRKAEGTGIGLSLVKSIVELHGGTIALESTVNVGSKFTISLPSKKVDNPVILQDDYIFEDRVEMIKFEFSDIYN